MTVLRVMEEGDLAAAQALSMSFGWPHRVEDWRFMFGLGEGVVAEREGVLVGTGIGWPYGADGAALGMIGVSPALQGQGVGRRIFERVLAGLGERRVLLHATAAGLPLYRSLEFVAGETIQQYQGVVSRPEAVDLAAWEGVRAFGVADAALLASLDRAASGLDRSALLSALVAVAEGVVLEGAGVALERRFGRGWVIGPVLAPDAERAKVLIGHYLAAREGAFVRVDVPERAGLGAWLEGWGLADAGPAVRMVRGGLRLEPGVFGLVSQAFG